MQQDNEKHLHMHLARHLPIRTPKLWRKQRSVYYIDWGVY